MITQLLNFLSTYLINGIPSTILVVLIFTWAWRKLNLKISFAIIRIIILTFASLNIIHIGFSLINSNSETYTFLNRATGPYYFSYLIMIFCSTILPFILLIKKVYKKKFLLLLIGILMNTGTYMETFVIVLTSYHADGTVLMPFNIISMLGLGGIIGLIIVGSEQAYYRMLGEKRSTT